jgi:hypothetical protein
LPVRVHVHVRHSFPSSLSPIPPRLYSSHPPRIPSEVLQSHLQAGARLRKSASAEFSGSFPTTSLIWVLAPDKEVCDSVGESGSIGVSFISVTLEDGTDKVGLRSPKHA